MFEEIQPEKSRSLPLTRVFPIVGLVLIALVAGVALLVPRKEAAGELKGILSESDPGFADYQSDLSIQDSKLSLTRNLAGANAIVASGLLTNEGNRSVDVVQVRVMLFNGRQKLWETVKTPVRPSELGPLRPLEERRFTLYVEGLPEDWRRSTAEMEISGFRFDSAQTAAHP